jgi:hypothetical protein
VVEYVMVPVPEDLVDQVQRFMMLRDMRHVSEARVNVDAAKVREVVARLNPECRTMLFALAHVTLGGENPTIATLAEMVSWTPHETFGVVHELNALVWEAFGPWMSLVAAAAPDVQAGKLDWEERTVYLWKDLATAVASAQADLATEA